MQKKKSGKKRIRVAIFPVKFFFTSSCHFLPEILNMAASTYSSSSEIRLHKSKSGATEKMGLFVIRERMEKKTFDLNPDFNLFLS